MDERVEPLQDVTQWAVEAPADIGTGTSIDESYLVAFLDQELRGIDRGFAAADHKT